MKIIIYLAESLDVIVDSAANADSAIMCAIACAHCGDSGWSMIEYKNRFNQTVVIVNPEKLKDQL